jgi:uncharacterized protein
VITEAFRHCHGIGPVRLTQLKAAGIRTWHDVVSSPDSVPSALRSAVLTECRRSLQALGDHDIGYFINAFSAADKWRVLSHFFDEATFFDIETTGLEYDATITVIVAWHHHQLHTFVEHENLDDFLDLLDETKLLVSFNGSSFDVPRVLSGFHIPELPCPHLDLRWSCHHKRLQGSLKHIAAAIGVRRPVDLHDADGALAVELWTEWQYRRNAAARDHLIRYCCADVLLLNLVSQHVCERPLQSADQLWSQLPAVSAPCDPPLGTSGFTPPGPDMQTEEPGRLPNETAALTKSISTGIDRQALVSELFGNGSPKRLRALRRPVN